MTKIEPTIGFSFRPIPRLSIDVAFMYVHGCGKKNVSVTSSNLLYNGVVSKYAPQLGLEGAAAMVSAMGLEPTETFRADYKLHAFNPSIGISYRF